MQSMCSVPLFMHWRITDLTCCFSDSTTWLFALLGHPCRA